MYVAESNNWLLKHFYTLKQLTLVAFTYCKEFQHYKVLEMNVSQIHLV